MFINTQKAHSSWPDPGSSYLLLFFSVTKQEYLNIRSSPFICSLLITFLLVNVENYHNSFFTFSYHTSVPGINSPSFTLKGTYLKSTFHGKVFTITPSLDFRLLKSSPFPHTFPGLRRFLSQGSHELFSFFPVNRTSLIPIFLYLALSIRLWSGKLELPSPFIRPTIRYPSSVGFYENNDPYLQCPYTVRLLGPIWHPYI